jgi:hypothetical protein
MKLSNLCMIALLAGTLGVFGCSDDPETGNGGSGGSGTAGTGGDGGTGGGGGVVDDPCTGGECENDQARKDACGIGIEYCNSLGAGGAGGAGGAPTEQQCDAVGTAICNVETGTGGTGGSGGSGGSGGAGGNPGDCDWTAVEICAVCEIVEGIADCEDEFAACLLADLGGNECEKCAGAALFECIK